MIYRLGERTPAIHTSVFVAPDAAVIGDVVLEAKSSIWFNCVLRGDIEQIVVGRGSNIQDGSIMHTDPTNPCIVGPDVTVGHMATLHGCRIGGSTLIGIGATLMNGSVIGANSIVGAHSLVTENKEFPEGVLIMGTPARVKRDLHPAELEAVKANSARYVARAATYLTDLSAATQA